MASRCLLRFLIAGTAFVATLLHTARAGEPSVRELIALAPVLDSADRGCRSLDIGGWLGGDKALAPKLRFRALFRAPNQFSLLINGRASLCGLGSSRTTGRSLSVFTPGLSPTVTLDADHCNLLRLAYNFGCSEK